MKKKSNAKGSGASGHVADPSLGLLAKLGSIAVHADELMSVAGHTYDRQALKDLLVDDEVVVWINRMRACGLVPEKRE